MVLVSLCRPLRQLRYDSVWPVSALPIQCFFHTLSALFILHWNLCFYLSFYLNLNLCASDKTNHTIIRTNQNTLSIEHAPVKSYFNLKSAHIQSLQCESRMLLCAQLFYNTHTESRLSPRFKWFRSFGPSSVAIKSHSQTHSHHICIIIFHINGIVITVRVCW